MAKEVTEFKYPLSLADREEQLFDNEYFSDVIFLVGENGERVYGHRIILTLASEVFYVQFNGQFEEARQSDQPITVTDIEPPIFRDVLRYMYCQKIDLSNENVIEVYYASQKYLLTGLNELCEKYFASNVDEKNVLKLFEENRKHEFAVVNKHCLAVIRDNPLACFQHNDFLALEKKSLEMITSSARINCCQEQLHKAIKNWAKDDESRSEDADQLTQIISDVQHRKHDCLKFFNFNQFKFVENIFTHVRIKNVYGDKPVGLYGLGIFVKSKSQPSNDAKISLKVHVEYFNASGQIRQYSVEKIVPLTMAMLTEKVFFEKFIIDAEYYCEIQVSFVKLSALPPMFCLNAFGSIDSTLQLEDFLTRSGSTITNCIAYLLYKNKVATSSS
ncbi:BTB/POZ domain-containing protein 3-like [Wyeomyia smithii]|uniref:BTB/POZ domain-containing protein 3-like n=1 Tax=Wyeomyia smithii TaxID=174621 RepID=UPI0024680115|nr:BTB/POZ domain-containing protein 3-like [Wyeomyia smithii]